MREDAEGFPILEGTIDMDSVSKEQRRDKALTLETKREEITQKFGLDTLEGDELLAELTTSESDTHALIIARITPLLIKNLESSGRIRETVRFGIHWFCSENFDDVFLSYDACQREEDSWDLMSGFWHREDPFIRQLMPEQLKVLEELADNKEY